MAIVSKFIYEEDQETGLIGFRPLAIKGGESTTSVAHDILEHFPSAKIPGVEGELMALGAMLAIRIEQGATSAYRGSETELAVLMMSVVEWALGNRRAIKPLTSRRLHSDYEWAENVIQAAAGKVHELLRAEHDWDESEMPAMEVLRASLVPWLRKGYRNALARYRNLDLYSLGNGFFKKIEKFSQSLANSEYLDEGTEVTFIVSPRNGTVSAKAFGQRLDF